MSDHIRQSKRALRDQIRAALIRLTPEQRISASASARALLREQALWRRAWSILFYAPMPEELDIWPLVLQAHAGFKEILLPRFDPGARRYEACRVANPATDLKVGHYGIREPGIDCARVDQVAADLILVPGLAFDVQGRRLGRGKGYYDQLLPTARGVTCGIAFEEQIVGEIPVEPHDVRLDYILTPERWIEVEN